MKDPYETLGVTAAASDEAIKKAFRKLAVERHPDKHPGNQGAEDEFKEISGAYEMLSNVKTRRQFDRGEIDANGNRLRRRPTHTPRGAPGWNRTSSSGRPFASFFRDHETRKRSAIKIHGVDVEYTLQVSFLDAVQGTSTHVSMTSGKRLKVNIPPGTQNGQTLRLKGQGMPGLSGGNNGDALVEITVLDDSQFQRHGNDIEVELNITLPEAVLGGKISVPTIDGAVNVTVPAGSNTGTKLRLKGKGLTVNKPGADKTTPKSTMRGVQYVILKVVLPSKPDKEFTEFVQSWSDKNPYDVRPSDKQKKPAK